MKETIISEIIANTQPYQGMEDDFENLNSLSLRELEIIKEGLHEAI